MPDMPLCCVLYHTVHNTGIKRLSPGVMPYIISCPLYATFSQKFAQDVGFPNLPKQGCKNHGTVAPMVLRKGFKIVGKLRKCFDSDIKK